MTAHPGKVSRGCGIGGFQQAYVTRRKGRRTGPNSAIGPRTRVKCGCGCGTYLDIHELFEPSGEAHFDTLEIGGVVATVAYWREILAPLLGLELPS